MSTAPSSCFDPDLESAASAILANAAVQEALAAVKAQLPEAIEIQKELALIEAPTFHEEKKAARYAEILRAAGLEDVRVDAHNDVIGYIRGTGHTGKSVLIEGHLDTVFSFGDVKGIETDEAGWIHCPGIADDTRALAANWSVLKAIRASGLRPVHDIIFAGTVAEEGLGGCSGMKYLLEELPAETEILAAISIDGPSADCFYANATGIVDWDVQFEGPGGHAWLAYGVPNAIQAACRAGALAADIELPADPKTIVEVSLIEGGQAIHAIAERASFKVNVRSNSQAELDRVNQALVEAFQKGADLENARFGKKDVVRMTCRKILDIPAGSQPSDARIIQAAKIATRAAGHEPVLLPGGCTNSNRAIAAGVPAVTLGRGGAEYGCHTLAERFLPDGVWACEQKSIVMLFMLAGLEGVCAPLGESL